MSSSTRGRQTHDTLVEPADSQHEDICHQLLDDVATALASLDHAAGHMTALHAVDSRFRGTRTGADAADFLDSAIRYSQAASAAVHATIGAGA